jgi:hypothetical protein
MRLGLPENPRQVTLSLSLSDDSFSHAKSRD